METKNSFVYSPGEHEAEKASNSYIMSLVALMAGMPLPIINLIATLIFFLGNKKSTYYVRWHCTQALLSQCAVFIVNSILFYWTISILFGTNTITNNYIGFIITVILFNITEFALTIYTAIKTRKGEHIQWWLYGAITNLICRE